MSETITVTPTPQAAEAPKPESSVPYERFKEINERMKAAEAKAAELEAKGKKIEEMAMAEQNQFKELAEKRAAEIEKLKSDFEAQKSKQKLDRMNFSVQLEGKNDQALDPGTDPERPSTF